MNPVKAFEDEIVKYTGARYAAVVCNGTAALISAIRACVHEKKGGYIVTTPFTFMATADAIRHAGFRPLFADIEENGVNIDPASIRKAVEEYEESVYGILPVHLFGEACRIREIVDYAAGRRLPVVEDASQAFGLHVDGKMAGTFGDAGTYSFYASKNMGACGEGGAVVTNRDDVIQRVQSIRDHGTRVIDGERVKVMDGFNFKMSWKAAFDGQQFIAMHKRSIEAELGEKGLEQGYYTRLVTQHPYYAEHPEEWATIKTPNAERLAEKQKRRFSK